MKSVPPTPLYSTLPPDVSTLCSCLQIHLLHLFSIPQHWSVPDYPHTCFSLSSSALQYINLTSSFALLQEWLPKSVYVSLCAAHAVDSCSSCMSMKLVLTKHYYCLVLAPAMRVPALTQQTSSPRSCCTPG